MIIWNRVTWYSKYLALLFFTLIFPIWTFYLGTQYEKAVSVDDTQSIEVPIKKENVEATTTETAVMPILNSGIKGTVTIGPTCPVEITPPEPNCADKPYSPNLQINNLETNENTIVGVPSTGNFMVALKPGVYKITDLSTAALPRMQEVENIIVEKGNYTEISIKFDSGIR